MTFVGFSFLGAHVAVGVGDPALQRDVEALFPVLRDPSAATGPPELVIEGLRLTRAGREEHFETVPALWSAVEYGILEALLEKTGELTHLHASGARSDSGAVLCVGPSGSGKSTLALALSRMGCPLLGDDLVLVDGEGRARGFPRLLKLDRQRAAGYGIRPEETLAFDPDDPEVWWGPDPAGWCLEPVPIRVLAFPHFEADAPTTLQGLPPAAALRALLDATMDGGLSREGSLDRFLPLVEAATLLEVRFGDARDAAARLVSLA